MAYSWFLRERLPTTETRGPSNESQARLDFFESENGIATNVVSERASPEQTQPRTPAGLHSPSSVLKGIVCDESPKTQQVPPLAMVELGVFLNYAHCDLWTSVRAPHSLSSGPITRIVNRFRNVKRLG